jgi:hypothetical protein
VKSRSVEIGRESSLAADKNFPQASTALEGQPVQNAALGQQLEQKRQHHFLLSDHDVAEAGFSGITLHLRLCQHS